jgi:aminotransferase
VSGASVSLSTISADAEQWQTPVYGLSGYPVDHFDRGSEDRDLHGRHNGPTNPAFHGAGDGQCTSTPYCEAMFDLTQREGIPTSQIGQLTSTDLSNGVLQSGGYTVLIDPNFTISATTPVGSAGTPAQAVQAFVNAGGRFVGTSNGGATSLRNAGVTTVNTNTIAGISTPGSTFDAGWNTSNPEGWGFDAGGWIYRESSNDPNFDPSTLAGNGGSIPAATAVSTFAPAGDCGGPAGFGNCYGYEVNANANLPGRPAVIDQPFGSGHAIMLGFDAWYRAWTTGEERLVLNGILYPTGSVIPPAPAAVEPSMAEARTQPSAAPLSVSSLPAVSPRPVHANGAIGGDQDRPALGTRRPSALTRGARPSALLGKYDRAMRGRPERLQRLPEQYFGALLTRVVTAASDGEPLIDLGRGNPETGPPQHVIDALADSANRHTAHGYPPFRGLPELRAAIAQRYRTVYGVSLDPDSEVAVIPATKTAIVELSLVLADDGDTILLPDPYYPDYPSGPALAGAGIGYVRLDPGHGWTPDFDSTPADKVAAVYLNYPSNPAAVAAPPGAFERAVEFARATGAAIVHDFAYCDLVFDGREPQSFLATPGAKDVGVEMFSMSKSYGMAGWRLGFVLGNAEIVERINLLNDHCRVGIFRPIQEAAIAALTGPQDSVAERRDTYQRRRDRVLEVVDAVCEGTFYVWFELPPGLTADDLLSEHRLAVAPGEGFGPSGAGWVRISLAVTDETLERGLERLSRALASARQT